MTHKSSSLCCTYKSIVCGRYWDSLLEYIHYLVPHLCLGRKTGNVVTLYAVWSHQLAPDYMEKENGTSLQGWHKQSHRRIVIHKSMETWRELKMVKSQAKTVVLLLSVRRPNNQVTPRRGSRMTVAFNIVLHRLTAKD